jgi:hypothetical protein
MKLRIGQKLRFRHGQDVGTVVTINPDGETGFLEVPALRLSKRETSPTTRVYFHVSEVEEAPGDAKPI